MNILTLSPILACTFVIVYHHNRNNIYNKENEKGYTSKQEISLYVLKATGGKMVIDKARKRGSATKKTANLPREADFDLRCKGH